MKVHREGGSTDLQMVASPGISTKCLPEAVSSGSDENIALILLGLGQSLRTEQVTIF